MSFRAVSHRKYSAILGLADAVCEIAHLFPHSWSMPSTLELIATSPE
jgi:hypothetical protein